MWYEYDWPLIPLYWQLWQWRLVLVTSPDGVSHWCIVGNPLTPGIDGHYGRVTWLLLEIDYDSYYWPLMVMTQPNVTLWWAVTANCVWWLTQLPTDIERWRFERLVLLLTLLPVVWRGGDISDGDDLLVWQWTGSSIDWSNVLCEQPTNDNDRDAFNDR